MEETLNIQLSPGKKVFFASDFHLGLALHSKSQEDQREQKILQWLDSIFDEVEVLFLIGDLFDFWFEYKHAIPKGFIRFQAKIAQFADQGKRVIFFTGNHDLWMFDYFSEELGVQIYRDPLPCIINYKKFLISHGDGLGPGDHFYKILKRIFTSKLAQFFFKWIHPDIGIALARKWSKNSRLANAQEADQFLGEKEYLIQYCKDMAQKYHYDYYIFGHRHLPLKIEIDKDSVYYNLGEWVNQFTYGMFDGKDFQLLTYKG